MPMLPWVVSVLVTFQLVYSALFFRLGGVCVIWTMFVSCTCRNFLGIYLCGLELSSLHRGYKHTVQRLETGRPTLEVFCAPPSIHGYTSMVESVLHSDLRTIQENGVQNIWWLNVQIILIGRPESRKVGRAGYSAAVRARGEWKNIPTGCPTRYRRLFR